MKKNDVIAMTKKSTSKKKKEIQTVEIPKALQKETLVINAISPLLYTVSEAAKQLRCGIPVIYGLINSGILPALKLGHLKIRRESLEEFVNKYDGMDLSNLSEIKALSNNDVKSFIG